MVGAKWQPAEGTIIGTQLDYGRHQGSGPPQSAAYDIDMRAPDGSRQRVQVASGHHRELQPGQIVRLEINAKTGEIRLPPHESRLIIGFDTSAAMQDNSAAGGGLPPSAHFLGGTLADRVSVVAGPEALDLVRSMMSGDAGARAAARDQLRQIALSQGQTPAAGQIFQQGQVFQQGQAHSPADRVARLQEMADRGQISQEEFEAKRQQILDEI